MSNQKPVNIRLDDAMDARIAVAAERSGLPRADIMRAALGLGLRDLELIGYKIEEAIHDRVNKVKSDLESKEAAAPQTIAPLSVLPDAKLSPSSLVTGAPVAKRSRARTRNQQKKSS